MKRVDQFFKHGRDQRIHRVRPVHADGQHGVVAIGLNMVVSHLRLFASTAHSTGGRVKPDRFWRHASCARLLRQQKIV
jgi:hypothetical protein